MMIVCRQAIVFKLNERRRKGNADVRRVLKNLANHDVKFVANNLDGSQQTF